jgi:hypothetical protein
MACDPHCIPHFPYDRKEGFSGGPHGAVKGARIPRSLQTLERRCGPYTLVGEENGTGFCWVKGGIGFWMAAATVSSASGRKTG